MISYLCQSHSSGFCLVRFPAPSRPGAIDIHAVPGDSSDKDYSKRTARKGSLGSAFPADPRPSIRDLGVCFYLPPEYRHSVEPVPPPTALQWVWLGTPITTSTLVLAVHKGDKLQLSQSSMDTEFCFLRRATPIYNKLGRLLSHPLRYLQGSPDGS